MNFFFFFFGNKSICLEYQELCEMYERFDHIKTQIYKMTIICLFVVSMHKNTSKVKAWIKEKRQQQNKIKIYLNMRRRKSDVGYLWSDY